MKRFRGLGERFSPSSRWTIRRLYPGQSPSSFSRYGMRYTTSSPLSPRARGIARTATLAGRNVRRRLFGGLEEEEPLLASTPIAEEFSFVPIIGQIIAAGALVASFTPRSVQRNIADSASRPDQMGVPMPWKVISELWKWITGKDSGSKTSNNVVHSKLVGDGVGVAHCYPGFPNLYTRAFGTPIAASA